MINTGKTIRNIMEDKYSNNKKEYYIHGGSETPQYYCPICQHAHTKHSKIGKEHKNYMVE